MKRFGNLIPEIVEPGNMEQSFKEVVSGLKARGKEYWRDRRETILRSLTERIRDGTFRIYDYQEFDTKDGPKVRKVQCPSVPDRIGCNAIMRVVERKVYPSVVRTSAASIPGRGMHHLHEKMVRDIRNDPAGTRYYYKCDIKAFYDSVVQDLMKACIRRYIKDPVLLPMLDNFVELLPEGLSKGLRSSQCYGNLLLSDADHDMKERHGVRYFYRYCDDVVMLAGDKRTLWAWRDAWHENVGKLGLRVKGDEAVRPLTEGVDFLGFVTYPRHSLIRKRTKQKIARRLGKVKSRKRRQELIGSFRGMALWGSCGHLYKKLTGRKMKDFKDFGLQYVAEDGKKRFGGKQVPLGDLANTTITIVDYETDVKTENGLRTVVSFRREDGSEGKYFTADRQQLWYLEKIDEAEGLPFKTTIKREVFGNGKTRYLFT